MKQLFRVFLLLINTFLLYGTAVSYSDMIKNIQENTIKTPSQSQPRDFKQALNRYINHTISSCLQTSQSPTNEITSHKKELRFLLNNHKKLSVSDLLLHLQTIHQNLMQYQDNNHQIDFYDEQICSALLLWCIDTFITEINEQSLRTLDEINNLILYWQYQQEHPVYYFFHKSPIKWIKGKSQKNEIFLNLRILKNKQRDLYTFLGSLTEHMHNFTQRGLDPKDCYQWIKELCIILDSIGEKKIKSVSDDTSFDNLIAQLQLYNKVAKTLYRNCLLSIRSVQKAPLIMRNWIKYTALCALYSYGLHYYLNNKTIVDITISTKFSHLKANWTELVLKPSKNIWNTIFGYVEPQPIDSTVENLLKDIQSLETDQGVNKDKSAAFKNYLQNDHTDLQNRMQEFLKKLVAEKYITSIQYDEIIAAEAKGNITPFKNVHSYLNKHLIGGLVWNDNMLNWVLIIADLYLYHNASQFVQLIFELIVKYGLPTIKELLKILAEGNAEWASVYKKVNLILNVAVLTPTILIAGTGSIGAYKFYRYATAQNYSPLRIALADINSLLIESDTQLNNCDYGKLLYLVYKLHSKAIRVEDPMIPEFLEDITKLESRRYSAHTKRDFIQNMFNKYTFLGRISAQR